MGPGTSLSSSLPIPVEEVFGKGTSLRLVQRLHREIGSASAVIETARQPGCEGCDRLVALYASLVTHLVALSERAGSLDAELARDRALLVDAVRRAHPESVRRLAESGRDLDRLERLSVDLLCQLILHFAEEQSETAMAAGRALADSQLKEAARLEAALGEELASARAALAHHDLLRHTCGAALLRLPAQDVEAFFDGEANFFDVVYRAALQAGGRAQWSLDGKVVTLSISGRGDEGAAAEKRGRPSAPPTTGGSTGPIDPPGPVEPSDAPVPGRSKDQAARSRPAETPGGGKGPDARPAGGAREAPPPGSAPMAAPPARQLAAADEQGVSSPSPARRPDETASRRLEHPSHSALRLLVERSAWTRSLLGREASRAGLNAQELEAALARSRLAECLGVGEDGLYIPLSHFQDLYEEVMSSDALRSEHASWFLATAAIRQPEPRRALAQALTPFLSAGWHLTSMIVADDDAMWLRLRRGGGEPERYRAGALGVCFGPAQPAVAHLMKGDGLEVVWAACRPEALAQPRGLPHECDCWIVPLPVAATDAAWTPVRRHDPRRHLR